MAATAQIHTLAALACLSIDEAQTSQLQADIDRILSLMNALTIIPTEGIKPMFHPLDIEQRLRQDECHPSDNIDVFAKTAPLFLDQLFLVPKVIEKE